MADTKVKTEAIMQEAIEAMKAVVQAVVVAGAEGGAGLRSKPVNIGPKVSGPTLK